MHFGGSLKHLADPKRFAAFLRTLFRTDWVVYAKPAFGGPTQVFRYLGRYTHRVAIPNHRLLAFDGRNVTLRWRDYAHANRQRKMTVSADEFIRRFLMHVLPRGFVRIRNFGFLANGRRAALLPLCRELLHMQAPQETSAAVESTDRGTWPCPVCHGTMPTIERLTMKQLLQSGRRCDYIDSS